MVIVGEFVGGAALGAAFGVLSDVVKEANDKSTTFKSLLKNIKSTLDSLKPVIEKIGKQNMELSLPEEEIKYLIQEMDEGVELIRRSSKVCKWNCLKFYYTEQLNELDGSLRRLLDVLKVQGVRDGKETLVIARKNNEQLVESARDGKETLALTRKIKTLVKRIERLVPCPRKGRLRNQRRNRVSIVKISAQKCPRQLDSQISETTKPRVFSFNDLKAATRNFRREGILGEGGFGTVFKGWVDANTLAPSNPGTGMRVAIKKWNSENFQGFENWQSEVNSLGRLSHPNIIKLLGHCQDECMRLLLVYEYMQKGSLADRLFTKKRDTEPLSWNNRLKIAIGAARALSFLHGLQEQIIHREFKPSNILLDEDYNVKLSGFGLTALGPTDGESYVEMPVMGTYGYAAPEYIATGHLYVKSDVYSFGVVLLEILTGLRAFDPNRSPTEKKNLVDWAKPLLSRKRNLKTFMDAKINGQYSTKEALQVAQISLKCLMPDPEIRPSMKEAMDELIQIQAIKEDSKQIELATTKSTSGSES